MKEYDFHIGGIIKSIVFQKHISSLKLVEAIHRYQNRLKEAS